MNFYIDFEANQFSNRIISVGCVSDSEQTFFQLCKPSKKGEKITSFITELTGITQEAIDMAKTADEVFTEFFDWIDAICYNSKEIPEFYCYGNSDKDFLQATVKYMTDFKAITMVNSLIASMKDYTKILNFEHPIGLIKLYNFLLASEIKQNHNSLDDAKKLKYVFDNRDKITFDIIPAAASSKTPTSQLEVFKSWPKTATDKYKADTLADETNWKYKIQNCNNKNGVKYFLDIDMALRWYFRYCHHEGYKAKNQEDIKRFKKNIEESIKNKTKFLGYKWEVNENV